MAEINNLFDFIDYLESLNREVGTANENRAFIFNTIMQGANAVEDPLDLKSAYDTLGFTVPDQVFNNIYELAQQERSPANIVQLFAFNSKIPGEDLPLFSGTLDTQYIVYADAYVTNPRTGDSYLRPIAFKFDDMMTPYEIGQSISEKIRTIYKENTDNVDLLRIYQNSEN